MQKHDIYERSDSGKFNGSLMNFGTTGKKKRKIRFLYHTIHKNQL